MSEALAVTLEHAGVTAMDALHAALASEASADFFATTDDRLLRKLKNTRVLNYRPVSLLVLVSEMCTEARYSEHAQPPGTTTVATEPRGASQRP